MIVKQALARLFNSHWSDCSTATGKIDQQWLGLFFNSHCHNWSTVTGTITQQSLVWLFNSGWHVSSKLLAQFFNSGWHDCSTVVGMIVQQSLAWLFNSYWHDSSTVKESIFFFFAGRILQQWCSLLKNRAMYQEYDTWSIVYERLSLKIGDSLLAKISFHQN